MKPPVPAEVGILAWSAVLVVVQIVVAAQLGNRQYGLKWAASARDTEAPPPGVLLGRARRALANLLETYPVFAVSVLAVAAAGRFDVWSLIGVHLYLWARVAYLGLYLAGVPLARSLAWNVALAGIVLVLAQLL